MRYSIIWLAAVLVALGLQGINGRALLHQQRGLPSLAPECISKDCTTSINHVHFTRNLIPRIEVFKPKPPVEIVPETEETTGSNTETESDPPPQQEITESSDTSNSETTTQQTQQELTQSETPVKEPATKDPTLVNSGDSKSGENAPQVLDGAKYIARGRTVQNNLDVAISKKVADKVVRPRGTDPSPDSNANCGFQITAGDGSIANVYDGYALVNPVDIDIPNPIPGETATLKDWAYSKLADTFKEPELGLSGEPSFTVLNWDSVELKAGQGYRNVNHGGYNADEGIIVVDDVEAANDNLASSDPERLQSSSITYQTWAQIAGPSGKTGGLKMVIQQNVKNVGTRKMIKDAYTSKGLDFKKDTGDWAMDPKDDARQQAFLALLAQITGDLRDFHNSLGDKKVTRILTYQFEGDEDEIEVHDGLGWWHMVLIVGN
ncbi:uncharacterized protein Bfra_005199 [Botrytis fragariae]|uniref:Uncharacterized protein n=1 Tax=Botrytis fragariae TaxID=1964551 RepID=A0A8H6EJ24_9HELO|nr:uncharacterized protein Bfra_005199 [Botrytis fragariae]KAF5873735.1 hypothetical protein Bfra_005199 [Botrytis fragariae]